MADDLPPLPDAPPHLTWSSNVHEAYQRVHDAYYHSRGVLLQEADASRLKLSIERLEHESIPILVAMESNALVEHLPIDWLELCADAIGTLVGKLTHANTKATKRCVNCSTVILPIKY